MSSAQTGSFDFSLAAWERCGNSALIGINLLWIIAAQSTNSSIAGLLQSPRSMLTQEHPPQELLLVWEAVPQDLPTMRERVRRQSLRLGILQLRTEEVNRPWQCGYVRPRFFCPLDLFRK